MTDPKGTILEQLIEELMKFRDFSEFRQRMMDFQARLGRVEHEVEGLKASMRLPWQEDALEIRLSPPKAIGPGRRGGAVRQRKRKPVKTRRKR